MRIAEGLPVEPEEAQYLRDTGMGSPDRPGERPLRPKIAPLHRFRPLPGQEDRVTVGPNRLYPPHPPAVRLEDVVENVPDEDSLRYLTGEYLN